MVIGSPCDAVGGWRIFFPAIYWHVYGWANAEPLWDGRPATYWRQQVRQKLTGVGRVRSGRAAEPYALIFKFPDSPPNGSGDPAGPIIDAIGRGVGSPRRRPEVFYFGSDARQMPVLTALAHDADPMVRGWAVWALGRLGWARQVGARRRLGAFGGDGIGCGPIGGRQPKGYRWGIGGLRDITRENWEGSACQAEGKTRAEPRELITTIRSTKKDIRKKRRKKRRRVGLRRNGPGLIAGAPTYPAASAPSPSSPACHRRGRFWATSCGRGRGIQFAEPRNRKSLGSTASDWTGGGKWYARSRCTTWPAHFCSAAGYLRTAQVHKPPPLPVSIGSSIPGICGCSTSSAPRNQGLVLRRDCLECQRAKKPLSRPRLDDVAEAV